MRAVRSAVRSLVFGSLGLGLALSACSGDAHDCDETRTCPEPLGFIDAGNFDDWWSAGAAGESDAASGSTPSAAGGALDTAGTAGAGGATAGDADADSQAGCASVEPRVLSVSPADGATGVTSDAVIVITFNCPMDGPAFEAAYHSADLPVSSLTFTWNDTRTAVTLKPKTGLVYQAGPVQPGTEPQFAAKQYHFGFSDLGCNSFGRPLASGSFTFATLREASTGLSANPELTGNWTDGEGEGVHNCLRSAAAPYVPTVCIGDDSNNVRYTGFVSFDLSQLPQAIAEFESASLTGSAVTYGATAALGPNLLEHVAFSELGGAALLAPPSESLGAFYAGAGLPNGSRFELVADVTQAVAGDYSDGRRSQFRLRFAEIAANFGWDDIELPTSDIRLSTTYLLP